MKAMTEKEAVLHFEESLQMEPVRPGEFHLKQMLGIGDDGEPYDLYMYGGGLLAQIAYRQFEEQGIAVKGVIDRNADKVKIPVPVLSPEEAAAVKKERGGGELSY